MKIAVDSNVFIQIMQNDSAAELRDPLTGDVITNCFRRAQALLDYVESLNATVILPTPVLSEYLIGIDQEKHASHLEIITGNSSIEVASFDELAAIECALLVNEQEKKMLAPGMSKAKLRFDRQILAIAIACGAQEIWTHDKQLYNKASTTAVIPKSLADIQPSPEQIDFGSDFHPD